MRATMVCVYESCATAMGIGGTIGLLCAGMRH